MMGAERSWWEVPLEEDWGLKYEKRFLAYIGLNVLYVEAAIAVT
jgi:hypothetical protein